jgi:hypothetical protein
VPKQSKSERYQGRTAATAQETGTAARIATGLWLVGYLAVYWMWPLPAGMQNSEQTLRRAHQWLSVFLADEMFARWFDSATLEGLSSRVQILFWASGIFAAAVAAGWMVIRQLRLAERFTCAESIVFSAAVGLNLVSLFTLFCGLEGLLAREVFLSAAAVVVAAAAILAWRDRAASCCQVSDSSSTTAKAAGPFRRLSKWWIVAAIPFAIAIIAGAMLPPSDFDVREYHLQAPKEFYQTGHISFLPHNVYANMPLGAEMLSLAGMVAVGDWWTGALVGKTLIAAFALLGALALFAAGRRFANPATGLIAAVLYLSSPWIALVSSQGLIDGAMAFYLFTALYAVLVWRNFGHGSSTPSKAQEARTTDSRLLLLAGFLSGAAVSTKYPAALFCAVPLLAFVGYCAWRDTSVPNTGVRFRKTLGPVLLFSIACFAACGAWLIKNAVLTGNPVYPLLYELFDGATRTPESNLQWLRAHRPPNYWPLDFVQRAAGFVIGSEWLNPVVFPLAAVAIWFRRDKLVRGLLAYAVLYFAAWWLFTHRLDRFWVPVLPLVTFLAALGATWTEATWWRRVAGAVLAIGLLFDFGVIAGGQVSDNRYLADLNLLRNDPLRVEPWHRYVNGHADEISRLLLVGDSEPFDLDVPVIYNTVFDRNIIERLARGKEPAEVAAELAALGISHVYVSWREIERYRSPGNYGITNFLQPAVFDKLVRAGVLKEVPPLPDDSGQLFRVVSRP